MRLLNRARPVAAALFAAALWCVGVTALARDASPLLERYARLTPELAASPFQRPLLLQAANASAAASNGDVYAVMDHPFGELSAALAAVTHWCDILILPMNVKRCVAAGTAAQPTLRVAVGRKAEQPVKDAFLLEFQFGLRAQQANYLAVELDARDGPMDTRNYRLAFEAAPIDAQHTFVHMSYAYASGLAARMATNLYLSTSGRDKVGFSIVGHDASGPIYVRGVQGVAERNTMRYFLAIEAYLNHLSTPPAEQAEARLRDWFAATERYPRQLREMGEAEYLAMKRRELREQAAASQMG